MLNCKLNRNQGSDNVGTVGRYAPEYPCWTGEAHPGYTAFMERPSKSQMKRDALSAQELGEKLVNLAEDKLAKVPLPEDLLEAVALCRRITKHGGRKRQLQYIGSLMRRIDIAPISEAVQALEKGDKKQVELHKLAEHWRDELIGGNDGLFGQLSSGLSDEERRQLNDLVTRARNEKTKQAPSPALSRMVFRFLFRRMDALKTG
jgi:ribosome-associated protein